MPGFLDYHLMLKFDHFFEIFKTELKKFRNSKKKFKTSFD